MKRVRFSSRLHSSLFRSPLPLTSEVRKNRERRRRNKECPESRLPTSELGRSIDYIVSEGSARQGRPAQEGREGRVESETDEVRRDVARNEIHVNLAFLCRSVGRSVNSIWTRESLFILALSLRGYCRSGKLDPIHDPTKYNDGQWRRRNGFLKGPLHV